MMAMRRPKYQSSSQFILEWTFFSAWNPSGRCTLGRSWDWISFFLRLMIFSGVWLPGSCHGLPKILPELQLRKWNARRDQGWSLRQKVVPSVIIKKSKSCWSFFQSGMYRDVRTWSKSTISPIMFQTMWKNASCWKTWKTATASSWKRFTLHCFARHSPNTESWVRNRENQNAMDTFVATVL